MTDQEIIDWLESPSGESWSRAIHNTDGFRTFLVTVVTDGIVSSDIDMVLWYA